MILLIEPPHVSLGNISRFYGAFGTSKADFVWPPLELMSIAGYLDKFQIKNAIYDAGGLKKKYSDIQELIEKEKPEMIIFSTSTTAIYSDVLTAAKAKEISKDIITVAVGTFVMTLPEETLKLNRCIDVAVYSDDEEMVVKNLIESCGDFSQVKGICYRTKNGKIIKN